MGVFILKRHRSEPVYQGRTVTEWLDRVRYCSPAGFQPGEPQTDPALVALKRLGAPAAPVCWKHLSMARELPWVHQVWMQWRTWVHGGQRLPDPKVSRWTCAAAALIYLGPAAGGGVTKVIDAVLLAPIARPAAANAFFLIGTNEASVLPALLAGLKDPRMPVREFCAEAIGGLAPWAGPNLMILTNLIDDPDMVVRNYAIGTLGRIGAGNPEISVLLQDRLSIATDRNEISTLNQALNNLKPSH
jgi:hypothetical protein